MTIFSITPNIPDHLHILITPDHHFALLYTSSRLIPPTSLFSSSDYLNIFMPPPSYSPVPLDLSASPPLILLYSSSSKALSSLIDCSKASAKYEEWTMECLRRQLTIAHAAAGEYKKISKGLNTRINGIASENR